MNYALQKISHKLGYVLMNLISSEVGKTKLWTELHPSFKVSCPSRAYPN